MGYIREPKGVDFIIRSEPLDDKARKQISDYIKKQKEENAQKTLFLHMADKYHLDFEVDKLTDSIRNRISGDSFRTEMMLFGKADLKMVTQKTGWVFDWKVEYDDPAKDVYKLTIEENPSVIQGLVSLSVRADHVFMNLLENAPFNRGKEKLYEGVAGNLAAFACQLSFQRGGEGFVAFDSKTGLISHYEEMLGARHVGGHRMIIDPNAAQVLINKYFKI